MPSTLARHKLQHRPAEPPAAEATSDLATALTKLSESISTINTQLAAQAKFNKVVEDKLAALTTGHHRDSDRKGKQPGGSLPRTSGATCTYCKRTGHTYDQCYKRQRDEQSAAHKQAPQLASTHLWSCSLCWHPTPSQYLPHPYGLSGWRKPN